MKYYKIFFSILVFLLLVIPLFHMNMAEITEQENRTLARLPGLKNKGRINSNYGKEFESWLGDRFWGRNQLINTRFQILYKVNGRIENEKAFIGDDGWMFEKKDTVYRPSIKKQRKEIKKDAEILKKFADKFKDKNIPIYLVLLPDRTTLYQKYWRRYYKIKPRLDYGNELTKSLRGSPIKIVNPQEEMVEAMVKEDLFFKDDSHLTSWGMYILLKKLNTILLNGELKSIQLSAKFRKKVQKVKHIAAIAATLGFPGKEEKEETHYAIEYPNLGYNEIENVNYAKAKGNLFGSEGILYRKGLVKNAPINKTLIAMGPCYSQGVFRLLRPLFSSSVWIRTNIGLGYGKIAKKNIIKEIQKLFDLKASSGIIIITQDSFEYIREALK